MSNVESKPLSVSIIHEGPLTLLYYPIVFFNIWPKWKPCYAVLTAETLYVYSSKRDRQNSPESPIIIITLGVFATFPSVGNPSQFLLKSPVYDKEYIFEAHTQENMVFWLNKIIQSGPVNIQKTAPAPDVENYSMEPSPTEWNQRKIMEAASVIAQWWFHDMIERRFFLRVRRHLTLIQTVIRKTLIKKQFSKKGRIVTKINTPIRRALWKNKLAKFKIYKKVEKFQPYRTRVIMELYCTETNYVELLDTIVRVGDKVFIKPLKALYYHTSSTESLRGSNSDLTAKKITKEHIQAIFGNIEEILENHKRFLADLKLLATENWSESAAISPIFIQMSEWLPCYVPYCNSFENSKSVLDKCLKNQGFSSFIETAQSVKDCHKLDLSSFLIAPIQRIPRYELLLKDLSKHTWPEHPDYSGLNNALRRIKKAATDMDRSKQYQKSKRKIVQLYKKLYGKQEDYSDLEDTYLNEGGLWFQSVDTEKPMQCYVFLFSEHLVITKPFQKKTALLVVNGSYKYVPIANVQLINASITSGKASRNDLTFVVHTAENEKYTFTADNLELKERWTRDITKAIEQCDQLFWRSRFDNDITALLSAGADDDEKKDSALDTLSPYSPRFKRAFE